MHHFHYKNGVLHAEGVNLEELAASHGTPLFVYSDATLTRHFKAFKDAFGDLDPIVCFAVKSNANKAVLALMNSLGGGADIVTGGELARALNAGIPGSRIVYSGVGKSEEEITAALEAGVMMFNMESSQELQVINRLAGELGKKAPVSLRVNPDVDAKTHPKITTGLAKNKFGLDIESSLEQYRAASRLENIEIKGVSFHIGSQLTDASPFADALDRVAELVGRLKEEGIAPEYLDLGGGLGITYKDETPPSPAEYAEVLKDKIQSLGMRLVLEPGRVIVGNAGVMLTKVIYNKENTAKRFVIVDAGMNDLPRPSLYDAFHLIKPVRQRDEDTQETPADVVGPICESSDFLAKDRGLPELERGEYLAVYSAGAYAFSMSSNYNSRPRAAEIMVKGDKHAVVRARETYHDLVRGESVPDWME